MDKEKRKKKAMTEPIYLVEVNEDNSEDYKREFIVMGTKGNEYKVQIKKNSSCTCMDYVMKKNKDPRHVCKHIYFVIKRVLKCSDELFDKRTFTRSNLEELFAQISNIPQNALYNPDNVKTPGQGVNLTKRKPIAEDDSCPICLEELLDGNDLIFCQLSCGNSIHKICFDMWCKKRGDKQCVFCRGDWKEQKAMTKDKVLEELNNQGSGDSMDVDKPEENSQPISNAEAKVEAKVEATKQNEDDDDIYDRVTKAPKRNKTALEFFTDEIMDDLLEEGLSGKKLIKEASKRWNNLTEDQQKDYEEMEEEDDERYQKQKKMFDEKGYYIEEGEKGKKKKKKSNKKKKQKIKTAKIVEKEVEEEDEKEDEDELLFKKRKSADQKKKAKGKAK